MPQTESRLTLTDLSVADINLLIAGLGKLPLEVAVKLWLQIKAQGEAQMAQQPQQPEGTPPCATHSNPSASQGA